MATVTSKVLELLEQVTGTAEVRENLDIDLFDEALLTSLGLVQLIVGISEALSISISPAEIERETWTTPRGIIGFVEARACASA